MKQTENNLFPVFLKLEKFRVLIVGGGKVALEKVNAVLQNSPATQITLVGKSILAEIKELSRRHCNLTIVERAFLEEDLLEKDFIIVAVNDRRVSAEIKLQAERRKIITNVADTPEQCDFYLGSVVRKGNMKIAISTNGKSPTFARRIRETLEENIPQEVNDSIANLSKIREYLRGDFTQKVKQLNEITLSLAAPEELRRKKILKRRRLIFSILFGLILLLTGYLFAFYFSPRSLVKLVGKIDVSQWRYSLIGLTAEVINGALGMAYGLTTTTMLLSSGVAPAFAIVIVHILEVFTAGTAGAIHIKMGNVNKKLFRHLLLPGIAGAIAGAYLLYSLQGYVNYIKPAVSVYTLALGLVIILKALNRGRVKKRTKNIYPLALIAGFLDSIGGGGWGMIVSSTLIAGGRSPRYTIGSVVISRFFVALASSLSLLFLLGLQNWSVIIWLVAGGIIGAPVGPFITKYIPAKTALWLVGITIIALSLKQIFL